MAEMPEITLVNLTKRELFAAMAMQGLLAHEKTSAPTTELNPLRALAFATAFVAVLAADALIAELAK